MITFRPVRGGFDSAINDSQNFYSLDGLYRYLLKERYNYYADRPFKSLDEVIVIEPAKFDVRLGAFVSSVLFKFDNDILFPCGYIW